MDPSKNRWVNSYAREWYAVPASYKTPAVLFIYKVKFSKNLISDRGRKSYICKKLKDILL
jgi:hypothetical protein